MERWTVARTVTGGLVLVFGLALVLPRNPPPSDLVAFMHDNLGDAPPPLYPPLSPPAKIGVEIVTTTSGAMPTITTGWVNRVNPPVQSLADIVTRV